MKPIDPARLLAEATPGPWSIHPHPRGFDEDRLQLGELSGPHWSAWIPTLRPGDARMITAAPDLARRCIALEAEHAARARGEGARIDGEPEGACPYPVEPVRAADAVAEEGP